VIRNALLLGAAAILVAPAAPAAPPPPFAVKAGVLHLADGRTIPDAVVIVKEGRVAALGSGLPVPAGMRVREGAAATAGFADLASPLPDAAGSEDARPFAPGLRASDGLDPRDRAAAAAARAGVLAALLLPSDRNPLGGRAAALRVAGGDGRRAVEANDAGLLLSCAGAALRPDRTPVSLAGLLRGLEAAFDESAGARLPFGGADPVLGLGTEDRAALAAAAAGTTPALLVARTEREVGAALRLAAARRLRPVLVDPSCGAEAILAAAAAAGIPPADLAVIARLDLDDPLFRLRAPGELARAGVRVGFGSGGRGGPGAVRRAAALAALHGMEAGAARAALLGRGFPLGPGRGPAGLAEGGPADLVLLDGDPLDPAARILGAWAGGEPLAAPRRRSAGE
jgi:imidazolonepropionase-like amidohydrolase